MTPAEALSERGYVILERVLSVQQIARIKQELAPYLDGKLFGRNDFEGERSERVYALLAKAPSVADIIDHPRTRPLIESMLPNGYWLSAALAIQLHPGETHQGWHIDDEAGFHGLPRPRAPLGVSTIWALDDFTEENGATEVVPGSHRWAEQRAPKADEIVRAVMPAGSVLVFAGNLYHRGGANRSDGKRLAITPQYCVPWLRQIENMPLAVPPEIAGRYSERVQELLGYHIIEPGFMGYVDGRHPAKLIPKVQDV